MAENWYYVQKGNRQGPDGQDVILSMITKQELTQADFVWKKGFDNWKKIKDVSELQVVVEDEESLEMEAEKFPAAPVMQVEKEFNLNEQDEEERSLFIRTGNDRGVASSDYGPFSVKQLKQLYKENRINGKTFVFATGMKDWKILGDLPEYQDLFHELPPPIKDADRRTAHRKPFVARLLVQNNKKLFEGLCRDISIGGMQILVNEFKGQPGDKISINVHPENNDYNFTASGKVVRILEGNSGFSFRFEGLSGEAKQAIEKYVQDN
ncbi:MAG: DUF4339 domain-containing protein [Bdellovibrionales bacterium]|nr:DUF4339 domain-containing protein [Bdellovibrionales bacterium]